MATSLRPELKSSQPSDSHIECSIVVPFYNEEENVEPLYLEIKAVMDRLGAPYEMVFVDDGSNDKTYEVLARLYEADENIRLVRLSKNFGQTAALAAGFDSAQGSVVIAMDGDLQYDPEDIPQLLEKIAEGYDIVSGWRKDRADNFLTRRLPSLVANWLMGKLSGMPVKDFGSTFKAYRSEVIKNVRLYGELHRFIPALASVSGATIVEVPIKVRPRFKGQSKYGLSRTVRVLLDFVTIKFLLSYLTRPLQFFGKLGLTTLGAAALIDFYLLAKKILYGTHILDVHGPLLILSILLIITGVQLISLGLIGEIISRTYYESQGKRIYSIKESKSRRRGR